MDRLIRSDELPKQKNDLERIIADSTIILCTLSMISNPALNENGTFEIVPFERLVIDEASQINAFEFLVRCSSYTEFSFHPNSSCYLKIAHICEIPKRA